MIIVVELRFCIIPHNLTLLRAREYTCSVNHNGHIHVMRCLHVQLTMIVLPTWVLHTPAYLSLLRLSVTCRSVGGIPVQILVI